MLPVSQAAEDEERRVLQKGVVIIQRCFRGYQSCRYYHELKIGAIALQSCSYFQQILKILAVLFFIFYFFFALNCSI